PLITTRAAARLTSNQTNTKAEAEVEAKIENKPQDKLRVIVPVYNPQTERYLLELASLLTKNNGGEIVPLAIARAEAKLDSPQLNESVIKCQKLLAQAIAQQYLPGKTGDISITAQNHFVNAIINASRTHELVILRSQRHRSGVDSLALGATTRPLLHNLN
ncbi:MAG: hypothetical protein ACRC8K_22610, partial [Waterburya sp.]